MTLFWPDVSNNNWASTAQAQAFVQALPGEGFAAVCHKVSEGDYYADPYWPGVRDTAKAIGLPVIGYHYVTTDDAAAQAAKYAAAVGDLDIPCMLDFEDNSGDINNFHAVWNAFASAGINVRLSYVPHWYWQQIGSPSLAGVDGLVASRYGSGGNYASTLYEADGSATGAGWQPYGGTTPAVWQFTDSALIAGINVDCNAFEGSIADLDALLGFTEPTGDTVTTPAPTDADVLAVAQDNQLQLRGPDLGGWPQLAGHTVVDALALIGAKLGIDGFGLVAE